MGPLEWFWVQTFSKFVQWCVWKTWGFNISKGSIWAGSYVSGLLLHDMRTRPTSGTH